MLVKELEAAIEMVRDAGKVMLEVYATDFDVRMKAKSDPVTEADQRVNDLIVSRLRATFPDDAIVAEESPDRHRAEARGRCWYVDPLDGTKEFVSRNGEFSVMIGLAIDGEAKLGVVYRPVGDKLYYGIVGSIAFLEEADRGRSLRPTDTADPRDLRLVVSRSHRDAKVDAIKTELGITREQPSGSVGLKVGLIAEQAADLYVHPSSKIGPWDVCAPEAILRAAGGRFTDAFGEPYRYQGDRTRRRGILACNAAAYDAVLPVVRTACASLA